MTDTFLRKVYSHHGLENWAKAVDVIQVVENALEHEFERNISGSESIVSAIMQIIEKRKRPGKFPILR